MDAARYEKLGSFYLGRGWDRESGLTDSPLLYDAKDLTTHALVVGMTGSGKTGLCVGMLEEAAIDGVPALVIDPKGDMGNLMLTFPELDPADFEPWVDAGAAARAGKTVAEHAADTAALWRKGLGEWGQSPDRIARFRESVDIAIYTPGSSAGLPLSVLRSFAAPPASTLADRDALGERIQVAVSGLLALLGIEADLVTSREHVLLSNVLDVAWRSGRSLELASLIGEIQKPPFDKLGVIDLEVFYPAGERMQLALKLNNLLASPGFASWLEGEPMDAGRLLYTEDGRPRISIVSLAHLDDRERMFVVTLLLSEVVGWMRAQSGTSSLRALLYMDEIFGFFPPSAAPPSKTPMLTLLKQARAFGLGVVLATQNPVDLDYKGLSNCGTWFIGRLQTERDKARVLDGLEAASASAGASLDRVDFGDLIGSLGNRVFLMNNVHDDGPEVFQTRWALSYLRGPLVRSEIETLMRSRKEDALATASAVTDPPALAVAQRVAAQDAGATTDQARVSAPALLENGIEEVFLLPTSAGAPGARRILRPVLYGEAQLHYKSAPAAVDTWRELAVVAPIAAAASRLEWDEGDVCEADLQVQKRPPEGFGRATLPSVATRAKAYQAAHKRLATHLYQNRSLVFYSYPPLKLKSELGESEGEFRRRVALALAESRDLEVEKLRSRFADRTDALRRRIATAEERLEREQSQLRDRKLQTAVTIGTSLLGAVFGRKLSSRTSGAARAIRDLGRSRRESDDVGRAEERHEDLVEELKELEGEAEREIEALQASLPQPGEIELSERIVRPLKGDLTIDRVALLWTPWQVDVDGVATPLFSL